MSTFLANHLKVHELESRLKKNPYLSKDCLPNFLDALVLKALKASNQIPKRDMYPHFYHWYVLMRQFADRTLDHWIKNHEAAHDNDETVSQVVRIINKKNTLKTQLSADQSHKQHQEIFKPMSFRSMGSLERETKKNDQFLCMQEDLPLIKKNSQTLKKIPSTQDPITDYFMSIKLSSNSQQQFQTVISTFEQLKQVIRCNSRVKMESIKRSQQQSGQQQSSCVRIYFKATQKICQQLQTLILRFSHVQNIQCKKHKRNQSL